ncbi:hypothetical protein H696_06377 [Fonticula alba]|uniref:Protein Asterix n=1 Tax=Fonticula alba TaxID=691883 RepID=A0A058YZS0_FONAL|nr:hypothetical protein H696_06377 [Fonticula alba]KCV67203.1 hypothetical protein H696_06377 [Fonticula alba]|eukprot:XP_009498392.1 hypothetical protein H696_06377 [Fonticula alba]
MSAIPSLLAKGADPKRPELAVPFSIPLPAGIYTDSAQATEIYETRGANGLDSWGLLSMLFSMFAVMLRYRYAAWASLLATAVGHANRATLNGKGGSAEKPASMNLMFTLMGFMMTYMPLLTGQKK